MQIRGSTGPQDVGVLSREPRAAASRGCHVGCRSQSMTPLTAFLPGMWTDALLMSQRRRLHPRMLTVVSPQSLRGAQASHSDMLRLGEISVMWS